MVSADRELLRRMGQGETLAQLAVSVGQSEADLRHWWDQQCGARVPAAVGAREVPGIQGAIRITRDAQGVAHIQAAHDLDAFFGFGLAVAQDRLFQLDYLRRKARGRLSEILGNEAVESDRLYRTLDLASIAAHEWTHLPPEIRRLVQAYSDGVNAAFPAADDAWPIEFDLLDYRPEPWSPLDSLVIVGEFRWYLTGRFPVIVIPELVKRVLGTGPRFQAFLLGEENDECILPPGCHPARGTKGPGNSAGQMPGGSDEPGAGSNNWVVAANRLREQGPLLASDPHVPFVAVSIWHQIHVRGGRFNFAGISLAGMPGVLIGRNERVAWGVTNNICSQRDLYQEQRHPEHPSRYRYGSEWYDATVRDETIRVRDAAPLVLRVESTRHGPLVDSLLPAPARELGPVSLRWLGTEPCGWVSAVIGMNGSTNVAECRAALEPWLVPTFNVVMADIDGRIGYQCTGRLPLRTHVERGFRQGWNADDAWQGVIPWPEMPHCLDPAGGVLVTANNRVAGDDFPWPLSGTWVSGYRARRLRLALEANSRQTKDDHRQLQLDVHSGRAVRCVPLLLRALDASLSPVECSARDLLPSWDCCMSASSTAASVFHLFFTHWCRAVTARRLPAAQVELVSTNAGGLAVALLADDPWDWFEGQERVTAIRQAFRAGVAELVERLGPSPADWKWGRLHAIAQPHFLSRRGELGRLLDRSGHPAGGDAHTINSSSPDANHAAWLGAGYRMLAEMGDPGRGLWSVELGSVSGHPGSPHYDDQAAAWHAGNLFYLSLVDDPVGPTLQLRPRGDAAATQSTRG